MDVYRYRLTNRKCSSERLGACEVCGKHVSEVFYQVEQREYTRRDNVKSWTGHNCNDRFGHESCLRGIQR